MIGAGSASAWRISASAPFIAAIRPNIPTTCWRRAAAIGESSASICAPPLLADTLGAQDGLYTRRLRDDSGIDECRIIGCIRETIDAQDDSEPAIAALANPRIEVVTLTITEKGYCHIPATGALDDEHPDIVHDLARPACAAIGAGDPRRRAGAPPPRRRWRA